MRKLLLIVPILLIGLYVGADLGMRALAEARVAQELKSSLGLADQPEVSLGGFPFLPKFFSGSFPEVRISQAIGAGTNSHVPFRQGDVTMRDVRFSPSRLVFGDRTSITATRGAGEIDLTGADLTTIAQQHAAVTVRLEGGHVVVSSSGVPGSLDADVVVENGQLSLESKGRALRVSVVLPQVLPGIRYTSATVEGNLLKVRFTIDHASISV